MSDQLPKRPKILTRLRIDEVSAVDKGAGEGVKIVLMKRAESAEDNRPVEMPDHERRYWQALGATALRHAEERYAKEHGTRHPYHLPEDDDIEVAPTPADDPSRFLFSKETFLRKTYADDARGDEADDEDEATPVDELDGPPPPPDGAVEGVPDKSISFDVGDKTITARDERALARWLSVQERIQCLHKSEDPTMSTTPEQKLPDVAKREGVHVICKIMVADRKSYGVSQDELVAMISDHERQDGETAAKCFSRHYEADTADGLAIRKAIEMTKNAPLQDDAATEAEKDAAAACAELAKIGAERWPSLSKAQQFARAFETNIDLAKRAYRRPSGFSTSFPFPR